MIKCEIEEAFQNVNLKLAYKLMTQYQNECPDDLEIVAMWTNYYLLEGDIIEAKKWALKGVRQSPLTAQLQYNLAYVNEQMGDYVAALFWYYRAKLISEYTGDIELKGLELDKKIEYIIKEIASIDASTMNQEEFDQFMDQSKALEEMMKKDCGLTERAFRSCMQSVGRFYYESLDSKRYIGIFKDAVLARDDTAKDNLDLLHVKGEFLKAEEGHNFQVTWVDDRVNECLIPIAPSEAGRIRFTHDNDSIDIVQYQPNRFQYYNVKNHTSIMTSGISYFGEPIPVKKSPGKKRLVLSIFVDGLANELLKGDGFKSYLPYTYEYFKKGIIFNRAYCTAEWTYPSIGAIMSGLDTTHHMLIHYRLDGALPIDVPTIGEYFKEDGYYTSHFGGNWRIIPAYGFARGIDRYVYQHAHAGFKVHEVITDAMDHIETFKDLNQYMWISIGDLHDIADGEVLPTDVQRRLSLDERSCEDKGVTSVKQNYSINKIEQFRCQARHVDRWLHVLYTFLNENYKDEEIVVSLFADHGQGFLVPDGDHFLSEGRSNVAFMFRGGETEGKGSVDEIVSTLDYGYILRYLSGIPDHKVRTDGRLPGIFCGSEDREYAITESIHPGDPYQAAIFGRDDSFYFCNSEPVQYDGRFMLKDYSGFVKTKDGQRIEVGARVDYYMNIIMKHIAPLLIYD